MSSGFPHDQDKGDGKCWGCGMWLEMTKSKYGKGMLKPTSMCTKATVVQGIKACYFTAVVTAHGYKVLWTML